MPAGHDRIIGTDMTPERIVDSAEQKGCKSISYTYTEPTIYFEFAYETARQASEKGIKNVFVTNGFTNPEPLEYVSPYLHGANVDLKAFSEEFYRKVCKARLGPVLDALRMMKGLGIWVEITTLIIPGMNDSERELRELARFILSLGKDVPWHISAFYPTYRMTDRPRTPVKTLQWARSLGMEEGLEFVYTGNVPGDEGENTYCPGCGAAIIKRHGFRVLGMELEGTRCAQCRREIPLIL
jgi:pyruvate formate lyase activating enzyme